MQNSKQPGKGKGNLINGFSYSNFFYYSTVLLYDTCAQ